MQLRYRQTGQCTQVMTLAAAVLMVLGLVTASPALAAYGGVNGRIAYSSSASETGTNAQIATILPDGSGRQVLTHTPPGVSNGLPTWSSDGRLIYFGRNPGE